MGFRRVSLIVLGGLLCTAFFRQGLPKEKPAVQFTPPVTVPSAPTTAPLSPELPFVIPGSDLILEKLVSYEGDFWEDGSDRYVTDIMALVVYNPRNQFIEEALLQLQLGGKTLFFRITCLAPNSRVLVLEQHQSGYAPGPVTDCRLLRLSKAPAAFPEGIHAENAGDREVLLRNSTADTQNVTLRCKRYDADAGLYLGGISYDTTGVRLPAGALLRISPERYVEGHTKVVSITVTP